jgi:acyl-CoA thioesterase
MSLPHPSDLELLGLDLEPEGARGSFVLTSATARPDGALYGGTAIAASVAGMEAATQRDALWVTTQFVASARLGETVDVLTEVLANGRRISQCRVTGTVGDRIVFTALGSTATPRDDGLEGQFETMPDVAAPDASAPFGFGPTRTASDGDAGGFRSQVDYRIATPIAADDETAPPLAMWARLGHGRPITPAALSFVADMVPVGIARSAGAAMGGGTSLDNSMRFGRIPPITDEWILLELRGHLAVGSHGHGTVKAWTADGAVLAVGGQYAHMLHPQAGTAAFSR